MSHVTSEHSAGDCSVVSLQTLEMLLEQLAGRARHQEVLLHEAWGGDSEVTAILRPAQRRLLSHGGQVRVLIRPGEWTGARERVASELVRDGFRVRVGHPAVPRSILIDNRQCSLPVGDDQRGQGSVFLIQESPAVAVLQASFAAAWRNSVAVDLLAALKSELSDKDVALTLRLLADGYKDQSAAKMLSMSVRTYRRRVAGILDSLGAKSRFQAGALAVRLGLAPALVGSSLLEL